MITQKYQGTDLKIGHFGHFMGYTPYLSIVECFREFTGMLWGQKIKVYTDHKNLVRDALGLSSNRVFRWRLTLEEYNPEIIYIKGIDNTVADAISRLLFVQISHRHVK